jgi:chitinase
MSYQCVSGQCDNNVGLSCPRVQRFSNPTYNYNGKAIGSALHDNARQLNRVRDTVAAYYTRPPTNPTTQPTLKPTTPTNPPTLKPTNSPPTHKPTKTPTTRKPTNPPTHKPTRKPTNTPTSKPI